MALAIALASAEHALNLTGGADRQVQVVRRMSCRRE